MKKHSVFILIIMLCAVLTALPAFAALPGTEPTSSEIRAHNDKWGFPHGDGVVLVLCGGGTKGLAHIGVMEVLQREKIPVAAIVGTSMGSIMGGLFAAGYTPAELRDLLTKVNLMEILSGRSSKSLASVSSNYPPKTGESLFSVQVGADGNVRGKRAILDAKDLYTFLSELTSRVNVTDFDKLPTPFAAIATDIETGETVEMRDGNLASALRASMSIPGIFNPWERDGRWLVDGGLKANLPVLEAKKMFPGHPIVAVNLSPQNITKSIKRMKSMVDIGAQTLDILMVGQIRDNVAAADLVISPHVSDFGTLDASGYGKIMDRGTEAAESKVKELHALIDKYHMTSPASMHVNAAKERRTEVAELDIEGIPKGVAEAIYNRYSEWIGKPLDMTKVSTAVKELSKREDVALIEPHVNNISRNKVRVTLSIERPLKYEFGIGAYSSNLNPDRWVSISAKAHDIFLDGDIGDIEYRASENWGVMARYFSPMDRHSSQFGVTMSALHEKSEPFGYNGTHEFDRYSGKVMWYRNIMDETVRVGIGYGVSNATEGDSRTNHGPMLSIGVNTLDDPILPSSGFSLLSDIWFPIGETVVTSTQFQAAIPLKSKWRISLSGGLNTGNRKGGDIAYAASIGGKNELYSLAEHPLYGDQAYWLRLGASKLLMKSWWGGIETETFFGFGQALMDWSSFRSWWELGVALSVPTNAIPGKLFLIYDRDNEFLIGYSIGNPRWWKGPLP